MNWNEFFAMGGRGFFVWGSYGVTLAVIVAEVVAARLHRRRALEAAREAGESNHET